MELVIWSVACFLVLGFVVARALRNAPPMPEEMAVADEDWNLIYQEQTLYQRPAFKREAEGA